MTHPGKAYRKTAANLPTAPIGGGGFCFTLEILIVYEVFDPCYGLPVWRVRWCWLAALLAWGNGLDYARRGEGWVGFVPRRRQ